MVLTMIAKFRERFRGFYPIHISFTLIELLVVISIIMILLSILLPALNLARDAVKKSLCSNNLRRLMLCTINYADDNNGWIPPMYLPISCYPWSYVLSKYGYSPTIKVKKGSLPQADVYWCPVNPPLMEDQVAARQAFGVLRMTYGWRYATENGGYFNLLMTKSPSTTWLIGDSQCPKEDQSSGGAFLWKKNGQYYTLGRLYSSRGKFQLRHHKTANAAFFDGGVRSHNRSGFVELGVADVCISY